MKRLAIICSMWLTIVGVESVAASAASASAQPSAMERLVRQEDARRNDPRLGLAEKPAPQPSAVERLVRQEDARANDPRLDLAVTGHPTEASTVQIIAADGFDWLAAGIGGIAVAAAFLVAVGLAIVVRSQPPRRA